LTIHTPRPKIAIEIGTPLFGASKCIFLSLQLFKKLF